MRMKSFGLIGLMLLAGCTSTPSTTAVDPLQSFAQQVNAFNKDLNTKVAAAAGNALTAGIAVGKAACGTASMANGLFQAAAPAVDPQVAATEAGVMMAVNLNCALVDAADPAKPVTPQVAQAVAAVVQAVPTINANIKAVNPAVAATAVAGS